MQLIQKTLFSSRIYTITPTALEVSHTNLIEKMEWSIPLDDIYPFTEKREEKGSLLGLSIILLVLSLILWLLEFSFIVFILMGMAFFTFINRANSTILLKTELETIIVNRRKPSKQVVDDFIKALFAQQKAFLRWKFGTLDADLDFDVQIVNFRRLRNMQIISDEEYEKLKFELKEIIKSK